MAGFKSSAQALFDRALLLEKDETLVLKFADEREARNVKTQVCNERRKYWNSMPIPRYISVSLNMMKKGSEKFWELAITADEENWLNTAVIRNASKVETPVVIVKPQFEAMERRRLKQKQEGQHGNARNGNVRLDEDERRRQIGAEIAGIYGTRTEGEASKVSEE